MTQPDNDTILIQKSVQGDQQAFSELVDRYGSLFLQTAYRLTGNWDDARDIVQEALLYAHASLDSLRDPQRFLPWVRAIIYRTYQGHRKKQTRRTELLNFYISSEGNDPSISAHSILPDQYLYQKELASLLHHSLQSLTERNRRIVELFYLEDWPIRKISDFLKLSTDIIKNRLRTARIQMRKEILGMQTLTPMPRLKPQRIARFEISGSFSGDSSNPFGLNNTLLYQRILAACRKTPLTPFELAKRIDADEAYVIDALLSLLKMEIIAEAVPNHYVANFFFPTVSDDQILLDQCQPYVKKVTQELQKNLATIKKAIDDCSFNEWGFGWNEIHWIVLYEWLPQPPIPGQPKPLSKEEINRFIGPLRPDGGHWYLSGHDLTSPFSERTGSRAFTEYDGSGRHYKVSWPGSGRLMKEKEFAIAVKLADGPKTETEILADLSNEMGREILAECMNAGFITRINGRYHLRFPFVPPEDEEKIADALRPVSAALTEARDEWQIEAPNVAKELGFDWLIENQPNSLIAGIEGLWGLNQQLQMEGLIHPPPDDDNPCWAMWAKVWKA